MSRSVLFASDADVAAKNTNLVEDQNMAALSRTCEETHISSSKARVSEFSTNPDASASPSADTMDPHTKPANPGPSAIVTQAPRTIHFTNPFPLESGTSTPTTSGTVSPASHHADHDSLANTDTEEDDDPADSWEFQITPDMTRRLSVVPPPLPSILTAASPPTLSTLPNELKLEIFSYLDPIDGTAFGLTSRHSYLIYRAIFPSPIALSTRRVGPNALEAAWAFKGGNGEQKCAHCGVYRCELWKHISTWMGADREYCSMKGNFGRKGREGMEERGCWRGKPSKPRRCGRHPERTTTVHQDDVGVREEIERVVREASRRLGSRVRANKHDDN